MSEDYSKASELITQAADLLGAMPPSKQRNLAMTRLEMALKAFSAKDDPQPRIAEPLTSAVTVPMLKEAIASVSETLLLKYRSLWNDLHTCKQPSQEWLDDFTVEINKLACNCKTHWKKILADNPADFVNWFSWTVKVHNIVNEMLKKPILTEQEATTLYFPGSK